MSFQLKVNFLWWFFVSVRIVRSVWETLLSPAKKRPIKHKTAPFCSSLAYHRHLLGQNTWAFFGVPIECTWCADKQLTLSISVSTCPFSLLWHLPLAVIYIVRFCLFKLSFTIWSVFTPNVHLRGSPRAAHFTGSWSKNETIDVSFSNVSLFHCSEHNGTL